MMLEYGNRIIDFMHGKDLVEYLVVRAWDDGYLVQTKAIVAL
jgi:hypothetical protein